LIERPSRCWLRLPAPDWGADLPARPWIIGRQPVARHARRGRGGRTVAEYWRGRGDVLARTQAFGLHWPALRPGGYRSAARKARQLWSLGRIRTQDGIRACSDQLDHSVIAGLVPAISLRSARPCTAKRDGRDKPGHDAEGGSRSSEQGIAREDGRGRPLGPRRRAWTPFRPAKTGVGAH
jgi:hypothetical protein